MAFISLLAQCVVFFFVHNIIENYTPRSVSKVTVSIWCGTSCFNYSTSVHPVLAVRCYFPLLQFASSQTHLGGTLGFTWCGTARTISCLTVHYGHCSLLLCSHLQSSCLLLQDNGMFR